MSLLDRINALFRRNSKVEETEVKEAPAPTSRFNNPVKGVVLAGTSNNFLIDRDFESPEFDLELINTVYNSEAYVRTAIDKYIELMFKAGWTISGKNPKAVNYIKTRLLLMAEATGIPVAQLFIEQAEDLVKYSNSITIKVRSNNYKFPPGISVKGLNNKPPVVGYIPVNVVYMSVKRDKYGNIKEWKQEIPSTGEKKTFKPEDVIHMYYKREKGNVFGTPMLVPVIDDIRALRQAEENVLRLIYRNLFPFIHYQVGLPQEGYEGTDEEVQAVRAVVENMDFEGGLVTTERHKVTAIQTNQIINARPYLDYFEKRVFTGLGVSEVTMGRGGAANRGTAGEMTDLEKDRVKAFQRVHETFVNEFMIKELLLEGGFDPVLNPEDLVEFRYNEIDKDNQIKHENHIVYLYEHNAITEDEMRVLLGYDPITDRSKMFINLVTLPRYLAAGKFVPPSTDDTDNKNQPTNQHGKKLSPDAKRKGIKKEEDKDIAISVITAEVSTLQNNVLELIEELATTGNKEEFVSNLQSSIERTKNNCLSTLDVLNASDRNYFAVSVNRTLNELYKLIIEAVETYTVNDLPKTVNSIFDVLLAFLLDRFAKEEDGEGECV